jgi:hypothetical protein
MPGNTRESRVLPAGFPQEPGRITPGHGFSRARKGVTFFCRISVIMEKINACDFAHDSPEIPLV